MKSRLPQGFGNKGLGNMQQIAMKAQKMQEEIDIATKELEEKEYKSTSGGGAVEVTSNGKLEVIDLKIKPEVVDPEEIEMLSDLVIAAVNESIRAASKEKEETIEQLSSGLNLPGMF